MKKLGWLAVLNNEGMLVGMADQLGRHGGSAFRAAHAVSETVLAHELLHMGALLGG